MHDNPHDKPRPIKEADLDALADIWFQGWHSAHAEFVPAALTALRTRDDFRRRLAEMPDDVITLGPIGAPLGFIALRDGEIYQLFLSSSARGTGAAKTLMQAGENRLRADGVKQTRFECIPENTRARAFYTKMGWQEGGIETAYVDTSEGKFPLDCLIFHKTL